MLPHELLQLCQRLFDVAGMEGADIIAKLAVTHINVVGLDRVASHTLRTCTARSPVRVRSGRAAMQLDWL